MYPERAFQSLVWSTERELLHVLEDRVSHGVEVERQCEKCRGSGLITGGDADVSKYCLLRSFTFEQAPWSGQAATVPLLAFYTPCLPLRGSVRRIVQGSKVIDELRTGDARTIQIRVFNER